MQPVIFTVHLMGQHIHFISINNEWTYTKEREVIFLHNVQFPFLKCFLAEKEHLEKLGRDNK